MKFLPLNFLSVMLLLLLSSCNSTAQDAGFTDIQPGGLAGFLEENDVVILDVRTPGEWEAGKVESALTINLGHPQFNESIAQLDRDVTYLVYCNSGNRSRIASRRMVEMGFTSIYNYNGYHYQIRREYDELGNQPSR